MQLKYPVYTSCVHFCKFIYPSAVAVLAVSLAHFSPSGACSGASGLIVLYWDHQSTASADSENKGKKTEWSKKQVEEVKYEAS